jgi:hypothetical protein
VLAADADLGLAAAALSLYHAEKLHGFVEASQGKLQLITTPEDIDRLLADRQKGETGSLSRAPQGDGASLGPR